MVRPNRLLLVLPLLVAAPLASASIERLTLRQMVEKADGGIYGEILASQVTAIPMDDGSEEFYVTTLTIRGRTLAGGQERTVRVSYPGGIIDEERGVWNSEAPSADDVAVGKRVVAFWSWTDDLGGGYACNALFASHGGLFPTFQTKQGERIVQGRGAGYAVPKNVRLSDLEKDVRTHVADIARGR